MTAKSTERSPGHEKGSAEPIVREEIGNLLAGGVDEGANILSSLAELGVRYVAQRALEQEQTDHLGRGRYEPADRLGLRNGYEGRKVDSRGPGRAARPAGPRRWGAVPVQANRVPEGNSGVLERLVSEMY